MNSASLRGLFLLGIFCVGCERRADLTYSPRSDLSALPAKQQEQIADALEQYFGTLQDPRYLAAPDKLPADPNEIELKDKIDRWQLRHGRDVYTRQCSGCHGTTGDGQGAAAPYLNPPPRDYRLGRFKFTSTPRGSKPRRPDLARIIRYGAKGTSMPSFRWISQEDLDAVIDYVMLLSSRGEVEYRLWKTVEAELDERDNLEPEMVVDTVRLVERSWDNADSQLVQPLTPEPPYSQASVEAGARAFVRLNCYKCHGPDGRGNKQFDVGKDDWGRTAYAADLTMGMLHGGRRPVDIYRRIYSGINGTPMPAFSAPDSSQGETETQRSQTIWNMVHFVTSIVEGKPLPMEIIDAEVREQMKKIRAGPAL